MRKAIGPVVVLAGAGFAAHAVLMPPSPPPVDAGTTPPEAPASTSRLSFARPMLAQADLGIESQTVPAPAPKPRVQATPSAPRIVQVDNAVRRPVGQAPGAAPPLDGPGLTRELQRQLRRVGCFHGPVTGAWTASTKAAMKDFTRRMNAALPVDEPDPVLLAMLQSHADNACDTACASGHERGSDGRCGPPVVAEGSGGPAPAAPNRSPASRVTALPAPVPSAEVSPTLPGRMALSGPKTEDGPASASSSAAAERHRATSKPARTWSRDQDRRRRPLGAWLYHDAPVDRTLQW